MISGIVAAQQSIILTGVELVGIEGYSSPSSMSSMDVSVPSGVVAGDMMIFVAFAGSNAVNLDFPGGWIVDSDDSSGAIHSYVATRVSEGSEPASYTVSVNGGITQPLAGAILALRGASAAVIGDSAHGSQPVATSVSLASKGALIGAFALSTGEDATVESAPLGMTLLAAYEAWNYSRLRVYGALPQTAGVTGDKQLVWSSSASAAWAQIVGVTR